MTKQEAEKVHKEHKSCSKNLVKTNLGYSEKKEYDNQAPSWIMQWQCPTCKWKSKKFKQS